jgi:hypothetical protein
MGGILRNTAVDKHQLDKFEISAKYTVVNIGI